MEEEEEDDEEAGDGDPTPQSQTHSRSPTPEENYIPDSPPISPVELKKELPKYLPALQVSVNTCSSSQATHYLCICTRLTHVWLCVVFQGCRSVEEFQCLNRIEEGTYGVVYRAKDKKTGIKMNMLVHFLLFSLLFHWWNNDNGLLFADEIVALKRLKMEKEKEGFPITSLREINTILKAQHPNIVTVRVRGLFLFNTLIGSCVSLSVPSKCNPTFSPVSGNCCWK